MKRNNIQTGSNKKTAIWYLYLVSAIMLAFTGFGQMPLYKRYYIADIPGMAWSADFYITHLLHYIFSILLFVKSIPFHQQVPLCFPCAAATASYNE